MSDAHAVRIEGLGRRFGDIEAVRGISLDVREGETFGLLGPNGAGKTTTLSMLATLLDPSCGDALIFGRRLTGDPTGVERSIGIAPQQISLYPDLSGEENLAFFGRIHASPRRDASGAARASCSTSWASPRARTTASGPTRVA